MNPREFLDGGTVRVAEPTALAEADVSVFALSAYSTDHVLVRRTDLDVAVQQLETLGCAVV